MKNDEYNSGKPSSDKTTISNYEFGNTQKTEYSFFSGNKIDIKDEINDNHVSNNINNPNAEEESAKYNKNSSSSKKTTKNNVDTTKTSNGGNGLAFLTGGTVVAVTTIITVAIVAGKVNYPKFEPGIREITYSFDLNETNDSDYYLEIGNDYLPYYYSTYIEPGHNEGTLTDLVPNTEYDIAIKGFAHNKNRVEVDLHPEERIIYSTKVKTLPDDTPAKYSFDDFYLNPEVNYDDGIISITMQYTDPEDLISNITLYLEDLDSGTSTRIELPKSLDNIAVRLYEYLQDFNFEDNFNYALMYDAEEETHTFIQGEIQFVNVTPSEESYIHGILSDFALDYSTGNFIFALDCNNAGGGIISEIYLDIQVYDENDTAYYGKYSIDEFTDSSYMYSVNLYNDNIETEHPDYLISEDVLENQAKTILTISYLEREEPLSISLETHLSDTRTSGFLQFYLVPNMVTDEDSMYLIPLTYEWIDEKNKYAPDEFVISFEQYDEDLSKPVTEGVSTNFLYIPQGYQYVDMMEVMTNLTIVDEDNPQGRQPQEGDSLKYTVYAMTKNQEYEPIYTDVYQLGYNLYDAIYGGYDLDQSIIDGCLTLNLVSSNNSGTYSRYYIKGTLQEDTSIMFYLEFDYLIGNYEQSVRLSYVNAYLEIEDDRDSSNPIKETKFTEDEWTAFVEEYFNESHKFTLEFVGSNRECTQIDSGLISSEYIIIYTL